MNASDVLNRLISHRKSQTALVEHLLQEDEKLGQRVRYCGSWLHLREWIESGESRIRNANFCKQFLLCRSCAARRAGKLVTAYEAKVNTLTAAQASLIPAMVTLTIKNMFGVPPISTYGDDAGVDEPNEQPRKAREEIMHYGKRPPSKSALPELDPKSERYEGYRVPRICVDMCSARPIHLAILDGIESCTLGEGPWRPARVLQRQPVGARRPSALRLVLRLAQMRRSLARVAREDVLVRGTGAAVAHGSSLRKAKPSQNATARGARAAAPARRRA